LIKLNWHITWLCCLLAHIISAQELFTQEHLLYPKRYTEVFERSFEATEVGHFIPDTTQHIILENGYASAILQQVDSIHIPANALVDTIDVVFSLYPQNPEYWLTNYHVLLARRLRALFEWDASLNRPDIHWRIILQTDCANEPEAIALFHGFVLHTKKQLVTQVAEPALAQPKPEVEFVLPPLPPKPIVQQVNDYILEKGGYDDLSVFQILDRNAQNWDSVLVVLDWTGSMYHHGAQVILYHLLHERKLAIQQFVFFNDGDQKKDERKRLGRTGGIYALSPDSNSIQHEALLLFHDVEQHGDGGDREENDVEALLWAIQKHSAFKEVVLVADNNACMRDFMLSDEIQVPVHVILPGNIQTINHQYINLAYQTKGSIHTLKTDVLDFQEGRTPEILQCLNNTYVLNPFGWYQNIQPMSNRFCNIFYGIERYGFKSRKWLETSEYAP